MQPLYRFLIPFLFLSSANAATQFFLDGLAWRASQTNDWAYINSEILPNQTISYKTIDFNYAPGFRIGASYIDTWDALFSYTRFFTTTMDSATGNIQPAFLGSVTAKPSHAYLYQSGNVHQSINYNIFDLDFGKRFNASESFMLHPYVGLIGGWIYQSIQAKYNGSTSTIENLSNNFTGLGPKMGVDTNIYLYKGNVFNPQLIVGFATSYLIGHWYIKDITNIISSSQTINVNGANHSMGAITLQGLIGIKMEYKKFTIKLAYEINDWFDQSQYFDNDTGAHNNDLILQGLTLGVSYG